MYDVIDDGVNSIKTICTDPRLVVGAGGAEMGMAVRVAAFGEECPGLDQYAVKKVRESIRYHLQFAEALEVVPSTLAENAGFDSTEVVSELMEKYTADLHCGYGVDIEVSNMNNHKRQGSGIRKVKSEEDPVMDLYATKKNALRLAVNAVLTILKVDQIIMAKEAGGPALRPPQKDVE